MTDIIPEDWSGAHAAMGHATPKTFLLLRLNARAGGLDVGDGYSSWQTYRSALAACPQCRGRVS